MEANLQGRVLWEDYALDLRTGELWRGAHKLRLQPLPRRALLLLLERPGEVVTREELHRRIWHNYNLGDFDHSLNVAINKLRAVLGDSRTEPRFIETVPQVGYRFFAEVRRVNPAEPGKIRLAVLPFAWRGPSSQEEYFCEGLTDELIAQLGGLSSEQLAVIARTSSTQYKNTDATVAQIGRELDVDYLLEGSVGIEGDNVRITASLIRVRKQSQLWAHCYRPLRSSFLEIQRNVAQQIVRSLSIKLLPDHDARLTNSPPA